MMLDSNKVYKGRKLHSFLLNMVETEDLTQLISLSGR